MRGEDRCGDGSCCSHVARLMKRSEEGDVMGGSEPPSTRAWDMPAAMFQSLLPNTDPLVSARTCPGRDQWAQGLSYLVPALVTPCGL